MKLGPHGILTTDAGLNWSIRAPIAKQVDRTDLLKAAGPNAIRIYRRYFPNQPLSAPRDVAAQVIADLKGYRHPRLYIEFYCEIYQRLGQGLEEYVAWTRDATAYAHEHGILVAGFQFSTGQPEHEDWLYIKEQGYAGVDAIALHEYWGGQGFTGWNALRYRKVHEWLGGDHPPFVITECGRDRVEGGNGGWHNDGVSADQYIAELLAYDASIQADPYVLGAVVYTVGPTDDWRAFEVDSIQYRIPGGEPSMPVASDLELGEGFLKAEPLVGKYLERETYHRPGQPEQVSFAWGQEGLSVHILGFNETITVRRDGQLWADAGNRGDGKMKRLR